jgi:hypothetical protein
MPEIGFEEAKEMRGRRARSTEQGERGRGETLSREWWRRRRRRRRRRGRRRRRRMRRRRRRRMAHKPGQS